MKTYTNIFKEMTSMDSLLAAWDEFKKEKRNKQDVQIFEYALEDNLFSLHADLITKRYKHGEYEPFYVRDPKIRLIHKAKVRDRIVHHMIFRNLAPIFEPTFIVDSYSCRINKGTHRAVKKLTIFANKIYQTYGRCFVLKCDIKKFFANLDHKILFRIISNRIKDGNVLWLMKVVIDSFSSEFSSQINKKGVPIGNLTSQLFANIYMNEFDQFVKQNLKVKYYIRYTDDFVIAHHDLEYLMMAKEKIEEFLNNELSLSLHPDKITIRKYRQGLDFLGYVVLPKAQILKTKLKNRIFKKLKLLTELLQSGQITEKFLVQSINSYLGVLRHGNNYELEQQLRHKLWEWLKTKRGSRYLLPTLIEVPKDPNCGGTATPFSPQLGKGKLSF